MAMRGHILNYNFHFHNFFSTSAILFYNSNFFLFPAFSYTFFFFLLPIVSITSNFYLLLLFFKLQTVLMETQTRLVLLNHLKIKKLQLFSCFSSSTKLAGRNNFSKTWHIEVYFKTMTCMTVEAVRFCFMGLVRKEFTEFVLQ